MTVNDVEGLPAISDIRSLFLDGIALLDVRAPIEFARGAFPNAVNLPLMNNSERQLVGIRYKESGQDSALALGSELISPAERQRRTKLWLAFAQRHPNGALYCFRGGLRSRISQQWLAEQGCIYPLVAGGYKSMRGFLLQSLQELCAQASIRLIGGRTGSGKTLLINRLGNAIDLEGLAKHRGSSFGSTLSPQPSNIDFENALTVKLMRLQVEFAEAIYLEDEARLIGKVCMPEPLRAKMQLAPMLILETSLQQRVDHALDDYVIDLLKCYQQSLGEEAGFAAFSTHHQDSLYRVRKRLGGSNYSAATNLLQAALQDHQKQDDISGYRPFIELMLERYYDPMYDYQLANKQERIVFRGDADAILDWSKMQPTC